MTTNKLINEDKISLEKKWDDMIPVSEYLTENVYSSAAQEHNSQPTSSDCVYYTKFDYTPVVDRSTTMLRALSDVSTAYTTAAIAPMVGDIIFHSANGKECVRIRSDGSVKLGEGISLDEASRTFWKRLQETGMFGQVVENDNDAIDTYSPAINQFVEFSLNRNKDQTQHNSNYERAMKVVR